MQARMQKLIKGIKENKVYIISYLIFFLILYVLMNQVVMYADDFVLKIDSNKSFLEIISYMVNHYFNWGGGLTPLFVILIFKIGFGAWKILNTFLITTMFFLFAKLISKNKKKFVVNFSLLWILFYIINIVIVRESIYWLDGSMAYVIPTFQVFMFVYMLYTRFIQNKSKKYDLILLPIVALFSGWSGAQTSAITLLITILFIIYYLFIKKNKVNKKFLVFVILGLAGSIIFLLSPGNGVRMENFEEFSRLGLINKVRYRISNVSGLTFKFDAGLFTTVPLYIYAFSFLFLIYNFSFYKEYKKKYKWLLGLFLLIQVLFLFVSLLINLSDLGFIDRLFFSYDSIYKTSIKTLSGFIKLISYGFMILFVLSNFLTLLFRKLEGKNLLLFMIVISAYCSQFSMVLSPYMPYRTCLTATIFLMFGIVFLINQLDEEKVDYELVIPLLFAYVDFRVSLLMLLFKLFLNNIKLFGIKNVFNFICLFPVVILAVFNYGKMLCGYKENKNVFNENIRIIENSKNNDDIIYLKRTPNPTYEFSPLIGSKWIEDDIKTLYNLDKNVKFEYKE